MLLNIQRKKNNFIDNLPYVKSHNHYYNDFIRELHREKILKQFVYVNGGYLVDKWSASMETFTNNKTL